MASLNLITFAHMNEAFFFENPHEKNAFFISLRISMQPKKAFCVVLETAVLLKKNEASIYPDTTGTIKELAAFWYNFTYIEVPPSLQTLIRNEARQFQQDGMT